MRYQEPFLPLQFRTILPDRLKAHTRLMSGNPESVTTREKLLLEGWLPVPARAVAVNFAESSSPTAFDREQHDFVLREVQGESRTRSVR